MDFLRSILALLLIGGLAFVGGLRGAVMGYLLHELAMCAIAASSNIRAHGMPGISFHPGTLKNVIRIGFPITLLWWILTLTGTVDRIVLGSLLGPLSVGYYGVGLSMAGVLGLVPMVVGRVLYPTVSRQFGKDSRPISMKGVVLAPTLALGNLVANIQVALLIAMPMLYHRFLPKYEPGLIGGEILIMGSFFGCLLRNGANYLIAANSERVFLKYIVITLVVNVALDLALVKGGLGITGVALGTSASGLLLSTLVWRRVLEMLHFQKVELWKTIFSLYLPIVALSFAGFAVHIAAPTAFDKIGVLAVSCAIALFVFVNGVLFAFLSIEMKCVHGRPISRKSRFP